LDIRALKGQAANAPNLIAPGIFIGKGFGDLPDRLAWLRPFGVTGAGSFEQPLAGGTSTNVGLDSQIGQLGPLQTRNVAVAKVLLPGAESNENSTSGTN
jgi:hypothetical protein